MGRDGVFIGEIARRGGVSRKALRLYEAAGILPPPRRTASRYRVYDPDALGVLSFIKQAKRLGFRLDKIKEIVNIRRSGRAPCPHVHELVRRKAADLDRTLADLNEVRHGLRRLLATWRSERQRAASICPHIERAVPSNRQGDGARSPGTSAKSTSATRKPRKEG